MNNAISFDCMHCNETIEADSEFAGQEVGCPGCNKSIKVPKEKTGNREELIKKYPDLQNRSEKELDSSLAFLKEYSKVYCDMAPTEEQEIRVVSIAFKEGIGKSMVKRYDNASFAISMQGSHQDNKKVNETLFGNKKLNKQLNKILNGTGVLMKKKKLFGLFG